MTEEPRVFVQVASNEKKLPPDNFLAPITLGDAWQSLYLVAKILMVYFV